MNNGVESLGQTQLPFSTSDAILAFSLCMAGVPFADDQQPCLNIYDAEMLKRMGFSGVSIFEAAEVAFRKKKKGHVEYAFKRVPSLRALLKMYEEQVKELEEGEGTPAELTKKLLGYVVAETMSIEEAMLRLACINAKMKTQFMSLWQKRDPIIRIKSSGHSKVEPMPDGGKRVRHPGFKLVPLHASQETRDKLKI